MPKINKNIKKYTIVGIGEAGCNIAALFEKYSQYSVVKIGSHFKSKQKNVVLLRKSKDPEDYERQEEVSKKILDSIGENVYVFVGGGSFSSCYTLSFLEKIKNKKINVVYVRSDMLSLNSTKRKIDRVVYSVLQEYTLSNLFENMYIVSNVDIQKNALSTNSVFMNYEEINKIIFWVFYNLTYSKEANCLMNNDQDEERIPYRIKTIGFFNFENDQVEEEKWFFDIKNVEQNEYYYFLTDSLLKNNNTFSLFLRKQLENNEEALYKIFSSLEEDRNYCIILRGSREVQGV